MRWSSLPGLRGALAAVDCPRAVHLIPLVVAATVVLSGCGGSAGSGVTGSLNRNVGSGTIAGAGSTFVEPFFQKAMYQYSQAYPKVIVSYRGVGSGAGVQLFTQNMIDFGATDVPMTDSEVTTAGGADSMIQIPTVLGAVAIAYNLPGVDRLQLDGDSLAAIYRGSVRRWDDPVLQALNPDVRLPARDITAVHRMDASGTTYVFTDYLSRVSPDWKRGYGAGKSVQWPGGRGAKGTAEVADLVQLQEGAIGYLELAYTVQAKLRQAHLKNASGRFVQASVDGATAAAAQLKNISPTQFSIVNQMGADSFPIAAYSWAVLRTSATDENRATAFVDFLAWAVSDGQNYGHDLQYASMPPSAQRFALEKLKRVRVKGVSVLT